MFTGRKIKTEQREKSLTVDWHDCAWVPAITVQAHVDGTPRSRSRRNGDASRCRVTKPLLQSSPVLHTDRHNLTFFKTMKTIAHSSRRLRAGFTLVELLVVIAIIGILAGMSMAVIPGVMTAAKKKKALLEAQDLANAIKKYDSDYGRFPVSTAAQNAAQSSADDNKDFTYGAALKKPNGTVFPGLLNSIYPMTNSEVIAILMNLTNFPNTVNATINTNYQKNPQKTIFLNAHMSGWDPSQGGTPLAGVDNNLVYRDPWGNPYVITMDLDYDEYCKDAFYGLSAISAPGLNGLTKKTGDFYYAYHGKVMVWSAGPDGKIDSGVGGPTANEGVNKDNVISW